MRNQLPRLAREEPVRLRVVDLAADDRAARSARGRSGAIWLSAAITHVTSIAVGDRLSVAGDDRGADAAVLARDG